MNRIFAIILLLEFLYSKPIEWSFQKDLSLKKDEIVFAKVSTTQTSRDLTMRWTLFKKDGVVVILKYDGFVHQFILYPDFGRNSFVLRLEEGGDMKLLKIIFKSFENKMANFWFGVQGDVSLSMQ